MFLHWSLGWSLKQRTLFFFATILCYNFFIKVEKQLNIKQLFESSLRNYKLQTIVWIETEKLWTIQTIVWIKPEKQRITNNCLN